MRPRTQFNEAGIVRVSLFGSTARGRTLMSIAGRIQNDALDIASGYRWHGDRPYKMLGRKVDLIEEGTLQPRVQKSMEAEVVRALW